MAETKDSSNEISISGSQRKFTKKDLEGVEVIFDYQGHLREREIALGYFLTRYPEDIDDPTPITKEQIGIFLYDLDNDGKEEILCYLDNSGYCGSAGCSFGVIKIINNNTQELIKANLVARDDIKILNTTHLEYHDLLFHPTFGKPIAIWRWNGKYYKHYE
jgi:hypothetical protein